VNETCQIWEEQKAFVVLNPSAESWRIIEQEFHKWNFPIYIGAIDGKHVMIQDAVDCCTSITRSIFHCTLALVDANYEFVAADVCAYGSRSDRVK
jgi:hypothetical protein